MISFEDPREQAWAVQLPFARNPDKGWQGDRPDEYAQEIYWQSNVKSYHNLSIVVETFGGTKPIGRT